jgi:hypothetical protein
MVFGEWAVAVGACCMAGPESFNARRLELSTVRESLRPRSSGDQPLEEHL